MTNPYHDGQGRFTSREGMVSAINKLADAQNVDAYLALKHSLAQIDAINKTRSLEQEQKKNSSTALRNVLATKIDEKVVEGSLNHYYKPVVKVGKDHIEVLLDGITDADRGQHEETLNKDVESVRKFVKDYAKTVPQGFKTDGQVKPVIVRVLTNSEREETFNKLNRKQRAEQFANAPRFKTANPRRVKVNSLQAGMVLSDTEKITRVYRDSKTPNGKYTVEIVNVLGETKYKNWNSSTQITVSDLEK